MKPIPAPFRVIALLALAVASFGSALTPLRADQAPEFQQVYDLVRSNLGGFSAEDLNRAAVEGLLERLGGRVTLTTNAAPDTEITTNHATPLIAHTNGFGEGLAYIRLGQVGPGAGGAFAAALEQMAGTNALKGLVLDLRFAGGEAYGEAARVASAFFAEARPLLTWNNEVQTAPDNPKAFRAPVAVLINRETRHAAEVLAALLRDGHVGLLLGSATAGQASVFREFPLSDGQRLQIATEPVKLAGDRTVPPGGLAPDIAVNVGAAAERVHLEDPYRSAAPASALGGGRAAANATTNRPARMTEAELVRMRREGAERESDRPRPASAEVRLITDPVLARAVDLLKGLAVLRPER